MTLSAMPCKVGGMTNPDATHCPDCGSPLVASRHCSSCGWIMPNTPTIADSKRLGFTPGITFVTLRDDPDAVTTMTEADVETIRKIHSGELTIDHEIIHKVTHDQPSQQPDV